MKVFGYLGYPYSAAFRNTTSKYLVAMLRLVASDEARKNWGGAFIL